MQGLLVGMGREVPLIMPAMRGMMLDLFISFQYMRYAGQVYRC